jgi:hypothetical protein
MKGRPNARREVIESKLYSSNHHSSAGRLWNRRIELEFQAYFRRGFKAVRLRSAETYRKREPTKYPHSAASLLENFFGTFPIETDPDRPWLGNATHASLISPMLAKYQVKFLIATLPGPASPALRSEFDNGLDAIISAADDQAYKLDRFDLPWEETVEDKAEDTEPPKLDIYETEGSRKRAESGEPAYWLKTEKESPPRSKTQPGILLFRPTDSPTKPLLIVFLVGEAPTHGINKVAMTDALDQIAWFWGLLNVNFDSQGLPNMAFDSQFLNILGPYFSGSALSMRNELEEWYGQLGTSEGFPIIRFFDGAATGIKAPQLGISFLDCDPDKDGNPGNQCSFQKFEMPDIKRWQIIIPDLQNGVAQGKQPPDLVPTSVMTPTPAPVASPTLIPLPLVALLSEESAYGAGPCKGLDCSQYGPIEIMPYPLQISDLRTAFAKQNVSQATVGPAIGPKDVPESDEGSEERDDVPPDFSTRSPSYDQIMLEGLLKQIKLQKTPYVGIMSSDASDLIFLSGQIRNVDPDATLFTLSADSRVLRQAINPDMYGMMVFSTYPIFPGYERWEENLPHYQEWLKAIDPDYPSPQHLTREFPSESAEAIYNAARSAIAASVLKPKYKPIAPPQSHILWTSVVGYNQFWPINVQSDNQPTIIPPAVEYPLSFILFYAAVSLICGGAALIYVIPTLRPTWSDHLLNSIDDPAFQATANEKRLYIAIFFIGILTAFVVITRYFCLLWTYQKPADYSSALLVPLLLTYLGLLLILPLLLASYISLLGILGPIFDWSAQIVVPCIVSLILVMFWIGTSSTQPWNFLGFLFPTFFSNRLYF